MDTFDTTSSSRARRAPSSPEVPTSDSLVRRVFGGLPAAFQLLLRPTEWNLALHPRIAARAVPWIVPLGLGIGLLWAGVFRLTWRLYGETEGLRIVPSLAVTLLEALLTGGWLLIGFVRCVSAPRTRASPLDVPDSPAAGQAFMLALVLAVLTLYAMILSIPQISPWPISDWRRHFGFVYPQPIYRPLVLAPLWGRWGLLLASTVGRAARHAEPAAKRLCRTMRPRRLLLQGILPLFLTGIYFSRTENRLLGVVLAMCVFGISYLAAVNLARRGGGQTRDSIASVGFITELAFLLLYRAFWPLIHQ